MRFFEVPARFSSFFLQTRAQYDQTIQISGEAVLDDVFVHVTFCLRPELRVMP